MLQIVGKVGEKRSAELFVYVRPEFKKFLKDRAKEHGITMSLLLDLILEEASGKMNVSNKKRPAKRNRKIS